MTTTQLLHRTRSLMWAVVLTLLVLAGQAMEYGTSAPAGPEVAVSVVPVLPEVASTDLEGEVWWTTTEGCAVGVASCYDPAAFTDTDNLPPVLMWVVQPGEVSDAMFDALLARGYRGDPSDGLAALYVPASVMVQECRTDSDCAAVYESMRQAAEFPFI